MVFTSRSSPVRVLPILAAVAALGALPAWGQAFTELDSPNGETDGNFGFSVTELDDLDGDARPDIVVGARFEDVDVTGTPALEIDVGRVYVFSGDDGSLLRTFTGTQAGEHFGWSVAGGGDFDADGFPDIAVGSPSFNSFAGRARILSCADGSVLHEVTGTLSNEFVGMSVASLGDIPRSETFGPDVFDDFAIGTGQNSSNSRVIVIGKRVIAGPATEVVESTILPPLGGNAGRGFGASIAGLDFNNDGTPDVAVGAPLASTGPTNSFPNRGRVWVFSGVDLATQLFLREDATNNGQRLGGSIANAGNFDGIAGDELVVGSPGWNPGSFLQAPGAVEVFRYDSVSLPGTKLLRIEGTESNMQLGSATAGTGDVNGDGFADALVGQAGPTTLLPGGNAYIFSGSSLTGITESLGSMRTIFRVTDFVVAASGDSIGQAGVAGARDFDGDGSLDWVVGAPGRGTLNGEGTVIQFSGGDVFAPPDPTNVAITAPTAGAVIHGSAVIYSATADNADEVEFFVNATSVGVDATVPYSITFDSTLFPDGSAELLVEARKGATGSTDSPPILVSIDNHSPALAITAPEDGAVIRGTVDFSATAVDPNGVDHVSFIAGATTVNDFDEPYGTSFNSTIEPEGALTLVAESEDTLGNTGTASVDVIIDNTAPLVAITSHVEDQWVSGTIVITATVTDANFSRAEFYAGAALILVDTDVSDGLEASFDTTTVFEGPLALSVIAFDRAENSGSASVGVDVDNTNPEQMIRRPADGRTVRNDMQVRVRAQDSLSGLLRIQAFVGDVLVIDSPTSPAEAIFDTTTVIDGPLAVSATSEDLAGNVASQTITVTVNNLRESISPSRLHLSRPSADPVVVTFEGPSVGLLVPVADHGFFLTFDGGPVLPATGGSVTPVGDEITVDFDRTALIAAIQNAFPAPPNMIFVHVGAENQVLATIRLRLRP